VLSLSFSLFPAALSLSPFPLILSLALYLFSLLLFSLSLIPCLSFFFTCLPSFLFFYKMSRQGHTTARHLLVSSFLTCFIPLEPKRQQGWLEQAEALGHIRQSPPAPLRSAPPSGTAEVRAECCADHANGASNSASAYTDGAVLVRIGTGERPALAEQHCQGPASPFAASRGPAGQSPQPHQCVPRGTAPGLGGMGQFNCCLGCRWVLAAARGDAGTARPHSTCLSHVRRCLLCRDVSGPVQQPIPPSAKPMLCGDVLVTQGHKTSRRDLLLFQDILIIAKLK